MAILAVCYGICYTIEKVKVLQWLPLSNMTILLISNPVLYMTVKFFPLWAPTILSVNILLLNIGAFLFIFFMGAIVFGFVKDSLCLNKIVPFLSILFGAFGLMINAFIDTFENLQSMGIFCSLDMVYLLVVGIWGFALWIFVFLLIHLVYEYFSSKSVVPVAGWNVIFYLGVYIIASHKMAVHFPSPLITGIIVIMTIMSVVLWIFNIRILTKQY
jgi:hypothetical protein